MSPADLPNDPAPSILSPTGAMDRVATFMSGIGGDGLSRAIVPAGFGPTEIYFPPEMIAGCAPAVAGQERDMAWQAAAEALDSERLHFVYNVHEGFVWFLAVKSADLASHSHSWCPFASLLPGMPAAQALPALYSHDEDGVTMLLAAAYGELHLHRGATTIVIAKAERLARDHGDAPLVPLVPEKVDALPVTPWVSASLQEDRTGRLIATASVLSGLAVAVLAFIVWLLTSFASLAVQHNVADAQAQSQQAVQQLMQRAIQLRVSPLRGQLAHFAELNEELIRMGGWLKSYSITNGKVEWKAVLPPAITADRITKLGGHTKDIAEDGITVVGNN